MGALKARLKVAELPREEELARSNRIKASGYVIRKSSEIARDALSIPFQGLDDESGIWIQDSARLPLSYFQQNCQWYIRGHWKQALAAFGAYALTFFIWTKLV
jgi:hypothetical protein